jgi:hypothetical protein
MDRRLFFRSLSLLGALGLGTAFHSNIVEAAASSTGKVIGTVTTVGAGATPNATMTLMTKPGMGQMPLIAGTTTTTDSRGHYTFEGVAPGKYTVGCLWLDAYVYSEVTVHARRTSIVNLKLPNELIHPIPPSTTKTSKGK